MISEECMFNSISIIPSSQDEVTPSGHAMNGDAITSVNGTPVRANGAPTFLKKASRFFAELKRRKVYKVEVAYAVASWLLIQGRIDFSADVRCTAVYDESSRGTFSRSVSSFPQFSRGSLT
jgi:hypothetical protein